MSRPHQTSSNLRNAGIVVFVLFVTFFTVMVLYKGCDYTDPTATLVASPSPTPANGSKSPAPAQNGAEQAAANANATAEGSNPIKTLITGVVKKDVSGEAVHGAVVVLFKTDTRGADPQITDAEGVFSFEKVPIKAGVTYSLQTKAPGLCGEESFTSDAISAQTIKKDLVLRPCQTQAPAIATAKTEQPDLTVISQGLGGMLVPLNSIKVWLQILATTWILTMVILLLTTLGLVFFGRQQLIRNRIRIDALEERARTFEANLAKHDRPVEPPTTLLKVPTELSHLGQQLISVLTQLATTTKTRKKEENHSRPAPAKAEPPRRSVDLDRPQHESKVAAAVPEPGNWYQNLLKGEATLPPPVFAEINSTLTDISPFAKTQRICFDEQANHGPFVIFRSDDGIGWIFPTPRANFSPDHHRVFQELDPNNFEQQKLSIKPREIIYQDGYWQLVL